MGSEMATMDGWMDHEWMVQPPAHILSPAQQHGPREEAGMIPQCLCFGFAPL